MSTKVANSKKILIVEDEQLLNDVYQLVLTKNNFAVKGVYNGIEAFRALATFNPDLILLDLLMPEMDGITFLQNFDKTIYGGVKIIVYSNLYDSAKAAEVKQLGADDIVLKSSMTPDQLVDMISSQLA
jgi:DNA-binding response OmpR family regulator